MDSIPHCEEYRSKLECEECEEGYYLNSNSSCVLIPPQLNCLRFDAEE